ncbi:hypothetical protein GCM10010515_72170 [Streptomyces fructofermentans]|uniref:Uncharacterized protein n=1 Tax=Streptomyces fructofermentans TaxID=152141 RepID=A0A918NTJ9_9ACTN|nr:hypothetical protein GCM10010515_72170 [Streptomyces fructofermentans]
MGLVKGRGTWSWIVPDGLGEIAEPLIPPSKVRPQGGGTRDTPDETLLSSRALAQCCSNAGTQVSERGLTRSWAGSCAAAPGASGAGGTRAQSDWALTGSSRGVLASRYAPTPAAIQTECQHWRTCRELAALRKERARVRSEKGVRWGGRPTLVA